MMVWADFRHWMAGKRPDVNDASSAPFVADAPIRSAEEDLLGRGEFARSLAKILAIGSTDHSLVLALRGGWGEGKSSLKNLVLQELRKDGRKASAIIEFNPWRYGDGSAIAMAFYQEIEIALGASDKSIRGLRRAHAFRRYSRFFTYMSDGLKGTGGGLGNIVGWLASLGFLTAGLSGFIGALPVAKLAAALLMVAGLFGLVSKLLGALAGEGMPDKPLQVVRADLEAKLKKLRQPLLVVIDDIDRLEPEEIRTVFRHVKANADLPKLTYLLLFQRSIVERALDPVADQNGRAYLEKIVQAPFDLPAVEPGRIHRAYVAALDKLVGKYSTAENGFDQVRWGNAFHGGLKAFFGNLRDVHRYLAAVSLSFELHRGSRVLEVNMIDFLVLEALRIFEPDVFNAIANAKPLLTTNDRDARELTRARVQAIIGLATEGRREAVEDLVKLLFPTIRWVFPMGMHYGNDAIGEWVAARRVCAASHFDRYFTLRLPDETISDSEFMEFLDNSADRAFINTAFADLKERKLLGVMLGRLDAANDRLPLASAPALLPALMDVGKEFSSEWGFGIASPYISAWRTAYWYIRQQPMLEARGEMFLAGLRAAQDLGVIGTLIELDVDKREKQRAEDALILTDEQLVEAKRLWVEKFREQLADPDALLANPRFTSLLYRWRHFSDEAEVKAWTAEIAENAIRFVTMLKAFRTESRSHGMGDHVERIHHELRPRTVDDLIDFDLAKHRATEIDLASLDAEGRATVEELLAAEKPDPEPEPAQGED